MFRIEKPGIYYDVPTADYFADCCPEPSLTQTLAKVLIESSPLHAYQAHPRLGLQAADEDEGYEKNKAIGNAAHKLILNRGKELAIAEFPDWRTKASQEFKAEAFDVGHEPILRKHFNVAMDMVAEAVKQLAVIPGCERAFLDGRAEVVVAAEEDGIWLRSMIDWITPDLREVWDFKTSGQSAAPYDTGRLMASAGWHVQAAMHERILDRIDASNAGRRRFFYVAQENSPPYALTVNEISESAMTIGRKMIDYAMRGWRHCLSRNEWPAYPMRIIRPELPGYTENAWLARELIEESENDPSLIFAG